MSITVLTIGGKTYTSYASAAEANDFLAVDPVREVAWKALSATDKNKKLVAATRRLDLLNWVGARTDPPTTQPNRWPRTGVAYPDGTAVSTVEVPLEVENAAILLAGSIAIEAKSADSGTSGTKTKRVKAGSVAIEFFGQRQGKPLQDETAFRLVSIFLESAVAAGDRGPLDAGTDGESSFADPDSTKFGRDRGFA